MHASTVRNKNDKDGKIRTHTRKLVNPLKLRARDICIEDVAHHLSLLCRYTGACPWHYSVAQHSVLVAARIAMKTTDPEMILAGLLHDSGEAYFNDLASPVKHDPRMAWYRHEEHEATRLICATLGVNPNLLPLTKWADYEMFIAERNTWWFGEHNVHRWLPEDAEKMFLYEFHRLKREHAWFTRSP